MELDALETALDRCQSNGSQQKNDYKSRPRFAINERVLCWKSPDGLYLHPAIVEEIKFEQSRHTWYYRIYHYNSRQMDVWVSQNVLRKYNDPMQCPVCDKIFGNRFDLNAHVKAECNIKFNEIKLKKFGVIGPKVPQEFEKPNFK